MTGILSTLKSCIRQILILSFVTRYNGLKAIRKGPGSAWGMSHFVHIFKDDIKAYVRKLITTTKPKVVAVCMIYFPAGVNVLL